MDIVTRTLRAWASEQFIYGRNDCALAVADYVLGLTGRDAAEGLRGHYSTQIGCARLLARHGGLLVLMTERFGEFLGMTEQPQRGDIGVVTCAGIDHVAALRVAAGRWAARTSRGLVIGSVDCVRAWNVPCPR